VSTPHFESTARWVIDKGSLSVWRLKVKEIARLHADEAGLVPWPCVQACDPSHYRAMSRRRVDWREDFSDSSGSTPS
jgi:hypothetical protein